MKAQLSLFENARLTLEESLELTAQSLDAYGRENPHWMIAYSGGKDSTSLLVAVDHLITTGRVQRPQSITLIYADTRMELPPLHNSAMGLLEHFENKGYNVRIALPAMDERFYVYMLGRGVPPPKNRFRWCTNWIKLKPMQRVHDELEATHGKMLLLTGMRIGESAMRDARIAMSCSKDGAECGHGWFQQNLKGPNKLAPILHWRLCNIWDWLLHAKELGYPTGMIAEAYGGDEAEEINARTGCIACPLASRDVALEAVIALPQWQYLAPLTHLRPLWEELRKPHNRLRKPDGRMGPLTFAARMWALEQVLKIQQAVNMGAAPAGAPFVELINWEERVRILELIDAQTWPQGWEGDEQIGDEWGREKMALGLGLA